MAFLLGVDTGGTYTDAVIMQDEQHVLASAKALTTRHDLAQGIGAAIRAVLRDSGIAADQVGLVSMSTTLATNALVEGQGRRVALFAIGFSDRDIERQGLKEALKGDPVIALGGGHDHAGREVAELDLDGLRAALGADAGGLSGYAVAAQFATLNPAHERAARDLIREVTGAAVSCSHELSSKLGGPKRAVTAVLNARLIGMIDHLIAATQSLLGELGIAAPLMVVRGDGALISAAQARTKPIETILSGPAASIVGARWLTDEQAAFVSDIGGTTTDIAILEGGRPKIDPQGARVGGIRTMVEAVAMRTFGLGGDSEVHLRHEGLRTEVALGPRRLMPVSLLACTAPELVTDSFARWLREERVGEYAGRFAVPIHRDDLAAGGFSDRELAVWERLGGAPMALPDLLRNRMDMQALSVLVQRGRVLIAGATPSDAAHVLGMVSAWDAAAARDALSLLARVKGNSGSRVADSAEAMARMIVDQLTRQTADCLMETAFAESDGFEEAPEVLARHILVRAGQEDLKSHIRLDAGLNVPVIGLGASAASYYGAVGARLGTRMVLPEHGGVANAIGAVVGRITMRVTGDIKSAGEGAFHVFTGDAPEMFADKAAAFARAEDVFATLARQRAETAGAVDPVIELEWQENEVEIEGRMMFVDATLTVTASGRAGIAA